MSKARRFDNYPGGGYAQGSLWIRANPVEGGIEFTAGKGASDDKAVVIDLTAQQACDFAVELILMTAREDDADRPRM